MGNRRNPIERAPPEWRADLSMTDQERRWVERLRRVLAAAPPDLELATIGDANLRVWRKSRRRLAGELGIEMADGGDDVGVKIARIRSACAIHGISG